MLHASVTTDQPARIPTPGGSRLTPAHLRHYAATGYFIVRGLVPAADMLPVRAAITASVANGGTGAVPDLELTARGKTPTGDSDHRQRLRKLGAFGRTSAVAWQTWWANPDVVEIVRQFVAEDVVVKFDAVFLKPAGCGGATPWHQDPGLWRDNDIEAINGWIAIDRSDRGNGCVQVVPGSHVGPVVPHQLYDDSVHLELPRDRCHNLQVDHIELDPGDAFFWHSNLWHHSPPNTSNRDRIGMGAVWTSRAFAEKQMRGVSFPVYADGQPLCAFPPLQLQPKKELSVAHVDY